MHQRSSTGNSRAADVVPDPTAADLNTRGEGVGGGVDGPEHHPWVYRGGLVHRLAGQGRVNAEQPVDLPMPSKETGEATDIGADG
ncbi:MAG: hypothetical protein J2P20_11090, partial [Pseudonocardia sp.]|nr:hypothetical protein [Pseudonocardia sp.]